MPDFNHIHQELRKKGVTKKLLWNEYVNECRISGVRPYLYTQFCHYVSQEEQKRHATMRLHHKPGEKIEVDWAGDHMYIVNSKTGELTDAHLFVATLPYSQYGFVEAFLDEKEESWLAAHVHMYNYFGGVTTLLVPDNCKTAVDRVKKHENPKINKSYQELSEYYNTAIAPARVRRPKDKPSVEGTVGNITTFIIASLRNERFFSIDELNYAIREKLDEYNNAPFQKREGSRTSIFQEEKKYMRPLPEEPYHPSVWKKSKVQFDYYVPVEGMFYSVPFNYIKKEVDIRITDSMVEVYFNGNRIASHKKLSGHKNQRSLVKEHMPPNHQHYLDWDGEHFRNWAQEEVGHNCYQVIDALLKSREIEQLSYKSCMEVVRLSHNHSAEMLEIACEKLLSYQANPSVSNLRNLLASPKTLGIREETPKKKAKGITRGPDYYRR